MIDTEFIQEQAEHYANVHIVDPAIVASVHIEDEEDKMFWDAQLQRIHPGNYNYIYRSKANRDATHETTGCIQCLQYKGFLSRCFFICIDSDLRLLKGEKDLDPQHFIAQTYTYSWENHCCEKTNLTKRIGDRIGDFGFSEFLSHLSEISFEPMLYLLDCEEKEDRRWTMANFRRCFHGQVKRATYREWRSNTFRHRGKIPDRTEGSREEKGTHSGTF